MILLTIPKTQKSSVKSLMALPPEEMETFLEVVADASPAASFRSLTEQIGRKLKNPIPSLLGILNVIAVIGSIREDEEIESDEMADQLILAAKNEDLLPQNADQEHLKRSISRLLESAKSIILTGKARNLLSEHEHVYCGNHSRVISDIRSIFPSGEVATPAGSVIVHMLKIAYHQGDADRVEHTPDVERRVRGHTDVVGDKKKDPEIRMKLKRLSRWVPGFELA